MDFERFGPYRLEKLIGRGGMGEVFRAWDEQHRHIVAVKRLLPNMAADRGFHHRFRHESAMAARLRDPHVIPIHDYGEINGQLYVDMRLVEGSDLATVLKAGRIGPRRAVDVVSQVAEALDAAHGEGLVHRDVKPSNVLLVGPPVRSAEGGLAYLADFGSISTLGGSTLGGPGVAVSTVAYMAPERMSGDRIDARIGRRVDVYSVACILFECLTGLRPFPAPDLRQVLRAHLLRPRPRPSEHGARAPAALDDVVMRGMAIDPDERYSSAGDLAEAARAALVTGSVGVIRRTPPVPAPPGPPPVLPQARADAARRAPPVVRARPAPSRARPARARPPRADGPPPSFPLTETVAIRRTSPPAPVRRRLEGGGRWVVAVAVFGAVLIAAAILLPRLVTGSPAFERVATIVVGVGPAGIAMSPDGGRAYVTNGSVGTVSMIDTAARRALDTAPQVGGRPNAVVVAPDGRHVYVTDSASAQLVVLDPASGTVTTTIPVGKAPSGLAISPHGERLYVASGDDNTVTVIDTAANAPIGPRIAVSGQPRGLAVSPDGKTLYVTGFGSNQLTLVDLVRAGPVAQVKVGDGPVSVVVTPDGRRLYVVNQRSGTLSVVDTVARTSQVNAVSIGAAPTAAALDASGEHLYVTSRDADTVVAVDTATLKADERFTVGDAPVAVAVGPRDGLVYVVGQNSTDVSMLRPTAGN